MARGAELESTSESDITSDEEKDVVDPLPSATGSAGFADAARDRSSSSVSGASPLWDRVRSRESFTTSTRTSTSSFAGASQKATSPPADPSLLSVRSEELSPTSAQFRIDAFPCTAPSSEHSTPSTVSSDYSPASTASEPDSPPLVTPTLPGLEVPMPSTTAPREVQEKKEAAINVSNFSGEQFVLAAPPVKGKRQTTHEKESDIAPSIGLGLGPVLHSQSSISSDLSDVFEDASDEFPPTASAGSVSALMTILDAYTGDSPTAESFKETASLSTSPSADSTVLAPSTKRYACLIEALSISFSRSTLDSSPRSSVDSSVYGGIDFKTKGDGEDDGYDSDASGNTDYYECSAESSWGLDSDEEDKQREAQGTPGSHKTSPKRPHVCTEARDRLTLCCSLDSTL